jgi:2-isopropylmalate synthase
VATDGAVTAGRDWTTVGVHENVVEASWHALVDALTYGLLAEGAGAQPAGSVSVA